MSKASKLIIMATTLFVSSTLLVGCGDTSAKKVETSKVNETKKQEQTQGDINKAKETKQLIITPVSVSNEVSPEENKKGNKLIKIHYKIKNKSTTDFTVAANDFIINIGENYYYMGSGINFADTIKPGQTSEGDGYYEIPKGFDTYKLMYQPLDSDEKAAWNIIAEMKK
ncbi:DUF4352 domain-containing protein [Listeria grandensis]|uniref:DUF4352 domain-containing protein n=1 Tax=Listeria grandensis TaxID=1494963 RepID=A0A7X0Y339_9LIST|nr:DUF4352 domain-containing protein [Listeria grandensis]MBC1473836.1 DUF4352 domain-containing protein [Listeria grandensis]MBC1936147.1 DUF4352 domain-containing protein [Listeria grandensis]MBC6316042.1 DUF4352 domain-containing protein [Listeria grandensis]